MLLPELPKGNHDFLTSHKSSAIMIEYTTDCNMRCSYCSVSKEGWRAINLNEDLANRIADEVIQRHPSGVQIHGHGETTMLPDWEKKAKKFIDAGLRVSICTNLAKAYSKEEMEVLAALTHMTISLDTIDVKLFKKLRRGGDIRHVIYNMTRVQDIAQRMGKKSLSISWSIVCCDKSIWGLADLVEYGISLGVNGFTFCNLGVSDVPKGGMETKHVSELPVEECERALRIFERIERLCKRANAQLDLKVGIIDTLKLKVQSGETHWTQPGGYQPV
jgi:MoaA/NifB/PqqE/SkfB family radical SAM enzyme